MALRTKTLIAALALALVAASGARAQVASPSALDVPPWFALSFLDFRDDVTEAGREGKRVVIYFGQDGCPYCKMLLETNFSQRSIVEKMRAHFVAVPLDLWGDRQVTWIDGRMMPEKELGLVLNVQFTPTLLFLDEHGKVVVRLNGYSPPQRFEAVLDYVAARRERSQTLADYLGVAAKEPASPRLNEQAFFRKPPYDLRHVPAGKPLAVLFETVDCPPCDELHREVLSRPDVLAQIGRFDVVRLSIGARTELTTPSGRAATAQAWAREQNVTYAPTILLFDGVDEVFRIEAYIRAFHVASALDYVASGAYRREPSFQRFIQARAEAIRARGERVDLVN
jgi:thioredoxin-related protein